MICKIVRLNYCNLVTLCNGGTHCQEQCSLRSRGNDKAIISRNRNSGELGKLSGQLLADAATPAIFGISLFTAAFDPCYKFLQRAGCWFKCICIYIAMRKVDWYSGNFFSPELNFAPMLAPLLAGSIITAEL